MGLAPIDDVLEHILSAELWLAADPLLGPIPETPGRVVVGTGAWIFPDGRALPAEVEAFLAAGEAPIFVDGAARAARLLEERLRSGARDRS